MTYKRKMWSLAGLAFGGAIGSGLLMRMLARDFASDANVWIVFPMILLIWGAVAAIGWLWWKSLDDVQKQGQLSSWYFGGMGGGVVLMSWLLANQIHKSDFGMGAAVMFFAQFAGYCTFYLFWWLRGRGSAE